MKGASFPERNMTQIHCDMFNSFYDYGIFFFLNLKILACTLRGHGKKK